jgi:molybdopterin-guanine dinucleotide biosynthesis protein B
MRKTQFIGVVGQKKSGKTTLIEHLVKEMTSRGFVVGTVKSTTHELEFDVPRKDTYRHRAAGSSVTLIKSKSQIALYAKPDYLDDDMMTAIFHKCDFAFIEGDSSSKYPKICVVDDRGMRDDISGEIIALWGIKMESSGIQFFKRQQIEELCEFLINRR